MAKPTVDYIYRTQAECEAYWLADVVTCTPKPIHWRAFTYTSTKQCARTPPPNESMWCRWTENIYSSSEPIYAQKESYSLIAVISARNLFHSHWNLQLNGLQCWECVRLYSYGLQSIIYILTYSTNMPEYGMRRQFSTIFFFLLLLLLLSLSSSSSLSSMLIFYFCFDVLVHFICNSTNEKNRDRKREKMAWKLNCWSWGKLVSALENCLLYEWYCMECLCVQVIVCLYVSQTAVFVLVATKSNIESWLVQYTKMHSIQVNFGAAVWYKGVSLVVPGEANFIILFFSHSD